MLLCIADVLSPSDVRSAQAALAAAKFRDGRATAGWSAARVKRNLQAVSGQAEVDELRRTLEARILGHALVALAARPKTLTPLILSRYEAGMAYGAHVDDALMRGMRSDLSLTLFLADPESYEGGELVIESSAGNRRSSSRPGRSSSTPRPRCTASSPSAAASGWRRWAGSARSCAMPRAARSCSTSIARGAACSSGTARLRTSTSSTSPRPISCGCGPRTDPTRGTTDATSTPKAAR